MIQNQRFIQFCRITVFMLVVGLFATSFNMQTAEAGTNGITPTPTPDTTAPTVTPIPPTATVPTPEPPTPTTPSGTSPQDTPTPTSTTPSTGSSNPNPDPTPTPNFPSEIPELGYGPSIWMSLSVLLVLTLILGAIATFVIRRISA